MKKFIALSLLAFSFSALANPMIKSAKLNPLVSAAMKTTAAEASMRLSACSTTLGSASGDVKDGSVTFNLTCNNSRDEYGVFSTVEGYFIEGKFYVSNIKVDRAG
jgi:hypothetical protein